MIPATVTAQTATPAAQALPASMKVFNQGGRKFVHHELEILPGRFTTVPTQHIEGIVKLISKYPTELVTADTADRATANLSAKNAELVNQVTEKDGTIKRLNELLLQVNGNDKERADKAEELLALANSAHRTAVDRIRELEQQNTAQEDRISRLVAENNRLMEAATKP